jgi:hypothetical protein
MQPVAHIAEYYKHRSMQEVWNNPALIEVRTDSDVEFIHYFALADYPLLS